MDDEKNDLQPSQRAITYPTSRLSTKFEPLNQLEVSNQSEKMLGAVATGKLNLIIAQIEYLKKQAREIIMKAEIDVRLHRASCSFEKRTGHTYYLYDREEDQLYFSILSPEDWKGCPPHKFLGAYRLEPDSSWTLLDGQD